MKKLVLLLVVLGVISCGSRKATVSKSDEKSEIKTEMNTELKVEEKHNIQNDISKTGFVFTENYIEDIAYNARPINPERPMVKKETVEGNTKITIWENAEVSENSKKDTSKKTEDFKQTENSVFAKEATIGYSTELKQEEEKSIVSLQKVTDAERGFNLWYFLLFVLLAAVCYLFYKRV